MMDADFDAIVALMQRYFDGLYRADPDLLNQVLHPGAVYACATGDELILEDVTSYLEIVRRREPPAARAERRVDAIEEIQVVGSNTAFVRARCRIAERHFTDFLTLIRDRGEWRIVAKVFHHEPWIEKEAA